MDKNEAEALVATLMNKTGEPDPRSWGEQYVELSRIHRKGTPPEQAASLQRLYRVKAFQSTHERMVSVLEEALFPQLAKALKTSAGALKARIHRGHPAFGHVAPERPELPLPDAPPLAGWEPLNSFRVFSGSVVFGEGFALEEPPEAGDEKSYVEVRAENGVWFHYCNDVDRAIAVHESALAWAAEFPSQTQELGKVYVEGASIPVVDSEVRLDKDFIREIQMNEGVGRACIFGLGGDGVTPVLGRERDKNVVLLGFTDVAEEDDD
jgi:hypothetical protein